MSDNASLGYDILSYNEDGTERYIEVKAVKSWGKSIQFYLSANELDKSDFLGDYYFYFVKNITGNPEIYYIKANELDKKFLKPKTFSVQIPCK